MKRHINTFYITDLRIPYLGICFLRFHHSNGVAFTDILINRRQVSLLLKLWAVLIAYHLHSYLGNLTSSLWVPSVLCNDAQLRRE